MGSGLVIMHCLHGSAGARAACMSLQGGQRRGGLQHELHGHVNRHKQDTGARHRVSSARCRLMP